MKFIEKATMGRIEAAMQTWEGQTWKGEIAYMQRRDAFIIVICGIVLARLEELLHAGNVADPRQLHNVVFWRRRTRVCYDTHLHVVDSRRDGGSFIRGLYRGSR